MTERQLRRIDGRKCLDFDRCKIWVRNEWEPKKEANPTLVVQCPS